jgi:hypothetical protein
MSKVDAYSLIVVRCTGALALALTASLALAVSDEFEPHTAAKSEEVIQNDLRVMGLPAGTVRMQGNVARIQMQVQGQAVGVEIDRLTGAFRIVEASPQARQFILRQVAVPKIRPVTLAQNQIPPIQVPGQSALDASSTCKSQIQGKIAWDDSSKQWPPEAVAKLCSGAEDSAEPGQCFDQVMRGSINWGGGTKWRPENAAKLCKGSRNARVTISCFQGQVQKGQGWQSAIETCN